MKFSDYLAKSYHRNLLEKLLFKYKDLIKGEILDIGSKNRKYDHLFMGNITAADIIPKPELNIIKADLTNLYFKSNSFDSVICLEVFQYLDPDDFKKAFDEIYRVLKNKGNALISFPFYCWEHKDNMRVTVNFILKYFKYLNKFKFKIIKIGNKYTSVYDIIRFNKNIGASKGLKNLGNKILLFIFYIIIKVFSLEKIQDSFYSGYFVIIFKDIQSE